MVLKLAAPAFYKFVFLYSKVCCTTAALYRRLIQAQASGGGVVSSRQGLVRKNGGELL
jgi:hypothetical protein